VTAANPPGEQPAGPVVRDKRRIDPETGQLRQAPESALADETAAAEQVETDLSALEAQLQERTEDVQRVHAEYANYRKRVDRDREVVRDQATSAVLAELLTVLDDVDRAREHGELVGGFKSVGEALEAVVDKLGLERYGEPGDGFDPTIHEALTHAFSTDVESVTCSQVFQAGYRFRDRVLRPARVAVAEPEQPAEG
jgi:molecular chaperone GrpE